MEESTVPEPAKEIAYMLTEWILTDEDLQAGVDLRQTKTLTAYVPYELGKSYQGQRKLWSLPPIGGSAEAQDAAQEISQLLGMDDVLKTLIHPQVIRKAGKL